MAHQNQYGVRDRPRPPRRGLSIIDPGSGGTVDDDDDSAATGGGAVTCCGRPCRNRDDEGSPLVDDGGFLKRGGDFRRCIYGKGDI